MFNTAVLIERWQSKTNPFVERWQYKTHPLIRHVYYPRIFAFLFFFTIFASIFYQTRDIFLWVFLIILNFLWPHIAFVLGKLSKNPRETEVRNFMFEAFLCGLFMSIVSFSLLPSIAFFIAALANVIALGGIKLFLRALFFLFLGIFTTILIVGFTYIPESSFITKILSIIFIMMYTSINSYASYMYAKLAIKRKDSIKQINFKLISTRDKLWSEMELAKKIQTILLPVEPHVPGFEISAYMEPADEVGGDYYDILNIQDRNWIVIGDVSGHGVSAGLVMMMVQSCIRSHVMEDPDMEPSKLLRIVNKAISHNIKKIGENKFMTITALSFNGDGRIMFSGRHEDLLLYRASTRSVEVIKTDGICVSTWSEGRESKDLDFGMAPDDILLLYTDGLIESWEKGSIKGFRDPDKDMYGEEKLLEVFKSSGEKSPDEIKKTILESLHGYECEDDVTFVIAKRM